MTKPSELREMNDEQLSFALKETQKDYFNLRFSSVTEKLNSPSEKKKMRQEIARIKTIQTEREPKAESAS